MRQMCVLSTVKRGTTAFEAVVVATVSYLPLPSRNAWTMNFAPGLMRSSAVFHSTTTFLESTSHFVRLMPLSVTIFVPPQVVVTSARSASAALVAGRRTFLRTMRQTAQTAAQRTADMRLMTNAYSHASRTASAFARRACSTQSMTPRYAVPITAPPSQ